MKTEKGKKRLYVLKILSLQVFKFFGVYTPELYS